MKVMKKAGALLGILFLMLSLISCESLFTTNLFGDLDKLDLSQMSDRELAGAILDDPSVVESYTEAQVDALVDDLLDLAADTSQSDNARMQAAAAASAAEMSASGADETVNNLGDLATGIIDGSLVVDSPAALLEAVFSDENGNPLSASEIEAQLDAMIDAVEALESYGTILGDGSAPAGVNADELAITALVVGFVGVMNDPDGDGTPDNDATAIANAITAADPETALNALSIPDMSSVTADDGINTVFGGGLANTIEGSPMIDSLLDLMES